MKLKNLGRNTGFCGRKLDMKWKFSGEFGSRKWRRKYFGRNVQSWIFLKTCSDVDRIKSPFLLCQARQAGLQIYI